MRERGKREEARDKREVREREGKRGEKERRERERGQSLLLVLK